LAATQVRHVFTSAGDPALFTARLQERHRGGERRRHVAAEPPGKPDDARPADRHGGAPASADPDAPVPVLGGVTRLYFDGDMDASVANTGQVSSRISDLLPASEIVRRTWCEIEAALDAARARGDLR
jgi:hypothetical protein